MEEPTLSWYMYIHWQSPCLLF